MARKIVVAGCAALALAALVGCRPSAEAGAASGAPGAPAGQAGAAGAPAATGRPTATGAPAATGTPAATRTPARQPTATHPPAVTPCRPSALRVEQLPGSDGAAGTIAVLIQVTNVSSRACTLRGYPTFTLSSHRAGQGRTVHEQVTPVHGRLAGPFASPVTTIRLAPNNAGGTARKAGFYLAYSNRRDNGDGGCDRADEMHLTVSGQPGTTVGPVDILVCTTTVQVSAYVPASRLRL